MDKVLIEFSCFKDHMSQVRPLFRKKGLKSLNAAIVFLVGRDYLEDSCLVAPFLWWTYLGYEGIPVYRSSVC